MSEGKTSLTSVFLRLGANNRFVIKDKFVITPWGRADLVPPFNGEIDMIINDPESSIIPNYILFNVLQGGVKFGLLF